MCKVSSDGNSANVMIGRYVFHKVWEMFNLDTNGKTKLILNKNDTNGSIFCVVLSLHTKPIMVYIHLWKC